MLEFLKQPYNILLISTVVCSGAMLVLTSLRRGAAVSPTEATLLMNREDALLIDVREPAEFESGHIPNARSIPLSALKERIGELEKFKSRPVIMQCASGARSRRAAEMVQKAGFERVYNLEGGIQAWSQANLPVSKGRK